MTEMDLIWTDEEMQEAKKESYNLALDEAIDFFNNHIHGGNGIVKKFVCEQLEKMKI